MIAQQFYAVSKLKEAAEGNSILFDEYEVIYEDLRDVILDFINSYTHPNNYKSVYIYNGNVEHITRKAVLTELLSNICYRIFPNTPVINNEAINKKNITSIAKNSRDKVIAALLRNDIEENLGFSGSGQKYRSCVVHYLIRVFCAKALWVHLFLIWSLRISIWQKFWQQ